MTQKPVKRKFGREEKRVVTRTSRRRDRFEDNNEEIDQSDVSEDGDEEEEGDEDEEEVKRTIAIKRNKKGDNKMAYSALVTLLKSEHALDEFREDEEEEDLEKKQEINESDNDEEDEEDEENEENEDEEDEEEEENEQSEDELLNKYDAFNLHFNDEEKIEKIINKFDSLPASERRLKLVNKEEIIEGEDEDEEDEEKFIKYKYGYPQLDIDYSEKSGNGIERKLKYHNVKKRVQERFTSIGDIKKIDTSLIESMLTYESFNFQYSNNERIKEKYQDYYLLHIMNHLLKTRDTILNNNAKKALYEKKLKEGTAGDEDEPEFRDQGYTRPKVLILLPSKNFAYKVVNKMIKNFQMENVENKKKFKTQFYEESKIKDRVYNIKPKDFEEYFDGNTDDMFVLGAKYTRKTLKLYSPLEQSDIIFASPIGLLRLYDKINSKDEENDSKKKDRRDKEKKKEHELKNNFLSSIEICIIDKAEGIMFQNWDNINEIMKKHLNQIPKNFMNIDFSRIRMWAINGQNEYLTQIMCFNKFTTPEMMSIVKRSLNLINGSTSYLSIDNKSVIDKSNYKLFQMGVINKFERLKQMFLRFDIDMKSYVQEPEKRLEFFKNSILPQILNKTSYKYGTLIYIPSYFDYLRVKNFLQNDTSVSFVAIDEYSSNSKITRNRALFKNRSNLAPIMLYTERLHFYKRLDIKGVRNVIFYQLPSDGDFYEQVLGFIGNEKLRVTRDKMKIKVKNDDSDEEEEDDEEEDVDLNLCMVRSIYSKLDAMRYAPIVGSNNVGALTGESEITEFS